MLYFSYASSIAPIALGFGSYLTSLVGLSATFYPVVFAIVLIFVLTIVNLLRVSKAAEADFGLVIIKIFILVVFIAFALLFAANHGSVVAAHFTSGFQPGNLSAIFASSVVISFAYSGFQAISTITRSIRGDGLGAAKAIVASVLISMSLYILLTTHK
jgi:APA family basic amino acid/polyamine antiporter